MLQDTFPASWLMLLTQPTHQSPRSGAANKLQTPPHILPILFECSTAASLFLVPTAHCTLQSMKWLQYWNYRFSRATYMSSKITWDLHSQYCHHTIDCNAQLGQETPALNVSSNCCKEGVVNDTCLLLLLPEGLTWSRCSHAGPAWSDAASMNCPPWPHWAAPRWLPLEHPASPPPSWGAGKMSSGYSGTPIKGTPIKGTPITHRHLPNEHRACCPNYMVMCTELALT